MNQVFVKVQPKKLLHWTNRVVLRDFGRQFVGLRPPSATFSDGFLSPSVSTSDPVQIMLASLYCWLNQLLRISDCIQAQPPYNRGENAPCAIIAIVAPRSRVTSRIGLVTAQVVRAI
jgi:hypothetical protein